MYSFPDLLNACKQLAEVFREKPELYTLLAKLQEKNEKELLATLNVKKIDDAYHGVTAVITFSDGGKRNFAETLGVLKALFNKSSDATAKAIVAKVDELARGRSISLESQASQQAEGDIVLNREFVPKYYAEDVVVETQAKAALAGHAEREKRLAEREKLLADQKFSQDFLAVLKAARQQYIEGLSKLPAEQRAGGKNRTQTLVQKSMADAHHSLEEFAKFVTGHDDYRSSKIDFPGLRQLTQRKIRANEDSYFTAVMDVLRDQYRAISAELRKKLEGKGEYVDIGNATFRESVTNARKRIGEKYNFDANSLKYEAGMVASLVDAGQEVRDLILKDFTVKVAKPVRDQVDEAEAKAKQQGQAQAATRPVARA